MESNPIQQRAEEFELRYLELSYTQSYTFLIFRTASDDWEMIKTFYDYMIGIDNEIEDVVLVFKSPLHQVNTYSKALVEELFMLTFLWNYADKPMGIEANYIDWNMDLVNSSKQNVAALFASNINAFCESVEFEEDSHLVCVLDYQNEDEKSILHWLKDLAKLELHPKIRFVLSDTVEHPIFNAFKNFAPKSTQILTHHFGLAQAIKEVAAMGDPEAPDTKYRYHLVQLYEAIDKKQDKAIDKHANSCLAIADQNTEKEANWHIQKVMIYSALATYAFKQKQVQKAIYHMDKGIAILQETTGLLPEDLLDRLAGQTHLFRGSLWMMLNKCNKAIDDFKKGEAYYASRQDHIMRIEAFRLLALAAAKEGDNPLRYEALNKGIRLGVHLNPSLIEASTYVLLIKEVLDSRYTEYIVDSELDDLIQPLLGEQWRTKTKNVKSIMANKNIK